MVNGPLISCTAYLHICFHHFFLLYFDRLIVYYFSSSTRIFHQMDRWRDAKYRLMISSSDLRPGNILYRAMPAMTLNVSSKEPFRLVVSYMYDKRWALIFCLFRGLEVYVPIKNVSLIWSRQHCMWMAAKFDLCSALMAIEQCGFSSVPNLLWHGVSVYNVHIRDPLSQT